MKSLMACSVWGENEVLERYGAVEEAFGASATEEDFVIGVRPEFLDLRDDGPLEGEIYSAMPTGMETTVKVQMGDFLLTGVVFGGVMYELGQKIRFGFRGDDIILFSKKNGRFITQGTLEV